MHMVTKNTQEVIYMCSSIELSSREGRTVRSKKLLKNMKMTLRITSVHLVEVSQQKVEFTLRNH